MSPTPEELAEKLGMSLEKVRNVLTIGKDGPSKDGPMLDDDIAECYRHAEQCARLVPSEAYPGFRKDFVEMEQRWLFLANS